MDDFARNMVSQETISAVRNSKPFAPITINNDKSIEVLFDTGSESSLLSLDILEGMVIDYTMEKCDDLLEGVEGTPMKIIGSTTLKVTFNRQSKIVRFTILEDKDIAILGIKAMNHMKVVTDTGSSLLCCNGLEQPFFKKGSKICNVKEKTNVF